MPRRNPPARWVLPEIIDPPDSICVTIPVPNDRQHIAAFWGAILNLASGINWADDPDHKARLVAHVWRDIFDALKPDSCGIPEPTMSVDEWEDILSICESLRFHDGKLQGLCCGEWTDISGQDGLDLGGPGQEGDGAPQPEPGGGCQVYHANFAANSTYLVPTLVSAGDTLTFTNPKGAGHDGSFLATWRCPDGGTFFGGTCLPIYASDGGDPNPSIHHIALIANINGTYYPAYSGVITVPGGVTNAQVILQVNDDPISDNGGSYSVDVEVCNNAVEEWSKVLDLSLSPHGFEIFSGKGTWEAGVGFHGSDVGGGQLRCRLTFPAAVHFTRADLTYSVVNAYSAPEPQLQVYSDTGFATQIFNYGGTTTDHGSVTNKTDIIPGDAPGARALQFAMDTYDHPPTSTWAKVVLYGTGPQPTWA